MQIRTAIAALAALAHLACLSVAAAPRPLRVIVDTDAANEVDDQHAITYAILSPRLKAEAVTVAHHNRPGSLERNFEEAEKVVALIGEPAAGVPVLRGGEHPMPDPSTPVESEAVDLIIERALDPKSRPPLYLVPHGPLTNIASAWLKAPEIAERVVVYWLGGTPEGMFREFNADNDLNANRCVARSNLRCFFMPASIGVQVRVTEAQARRDMAQCDVGEYLASLWQGSRGLFDVGTYVALVHAEWFETKPVRVDDELRYVDDEAGPFQVYTTIDAAKAIADFLAIFPDERPPRLVHAWAEGADTVRLVFSEPVRRRAASVPSHYAISGQRPHAARLVAPDQVLLTLRARLDADTPHVVQVSGLADAHGNRMAAPDEAAFTYRPGLRPGVRVEYFHLPEEQVDRVPDLSQRDVAAAAVLHQINIPATMEAFPGCGRPNWFAARFTALLDAPADGEYEFTVESDDGAKLWLDGKLVVVNDGVHGMQAKSGTATLTAGLHELEIAYFEWDNPAGLILGWRRPGGPSEVVPVGCLWLREPR